MIKFYFNQNSLVMLTTEDWLNQIKSDLTNNKQRLRSFDGLTITELAAKYEDGIKLLVHKAAYLGYEKIIMAKVNNYNKNNILNYAAEGGHLDIIEYCFKRGFRSDINILMASAAQGNQLEVVKYAMAEGATRYEVAAAWAGAAGHRDMVQFLLGFNISSYRIVMYMTAHAGHMEIIKLILEYAHDDEDIDWNYTMRGAAESGNLEILKLALSKGADNWANSFTSAAESGRLQVIQYLLPNIHDIAIFNNAAATAAKNGKTEIVEFLFTLFITYDWDLLLKTAVFGGQPRIVELVITKAKQNNVKLDFNAALMIVAQSYWKNIANEIIDLLINNGANNLDEVLIKAAENGIPDHIYEYLITKSTKQIDLLMEAAALAKKCYNGHTAKIIEKYIQH